MSGGKYSVVTTLPTRLNPFSSNKQQRHSSSLVDSPEACEEPEGLVSLPGAETDFQIKDIPIVTGLESDEDMPYMKPISPECVPSYLTSTCSSPDTASLETACPPDTRDFDHMYASLSKVDPNVLMAENVHLREMLVSQLDLIQQQAETILSKDKQLKQLKEENGLLVQRLSRMERRVRGEQNQGVSQGGQKKRARDSSSEPTPPPLSLKKKKVEENISWSLDRYKQSEDVGSGREDELMDEIMADSEHSGLVSRPDTPASVASNDTCKSDQARKGQKKQKKKILEPKRKSLPATLVKSESNISDRESRNKKLRGSSSDSMQFLETPSLYYVGCQNELLPNPEDKLDEVAALQRGVEVPSFREDKHYYDLIVPNKVKLNFKKESTSWRVKSTNPLYSQDASGPSENISDQNLLKRHEKFEKEEKQRKRWDLQRLREETQLQRLRARQEKQILSINQLKREDTPSILPNLEMITHISVEETLPVSAFGRPVPVLPQTSFSLPWLEPKYGK